MGIHFSDGLSVEDSLQTEHTVCGRVLRTDIDDIVVVGEQLVLYLAQRTIIGKFIFHGVVGFHVVGEREVVLILLHVIVLAEGEPLEISAQVKATHVLMSREDDAIEVVDLTFKHLSPFPQVAHSRDIRIVAVVIDRLNGHALVCVSILEDIDGSEPLFAEVFADDGDEEVEMAFVFQFGHFLVEAFDGYEFKIEFHITVPPP